MCGIAGIYGLEQIADPNACMRAMVESIEHRGPDAQGFFQGRNIVLGHRRLSIIDLDEKSNQPFVSFDGRYAIAFNGEIYNYLEIRAKLSGVEFRTNSDTEVLLAAFIKWGVKSFQMLNGMFACAIWDNEEQKLVLVRDRLGIKPLYYSTMNGAVVFSSEVRSLLNSGLINRKLNKNAIQEYLQYQCVHAPRTMVEDVFMLEAGAYLEITDNQFKPQYFWKPWQENHSDVQSEVVKAKIKGKLIQSVERRLVADVPVGAFLSGGIDSSLIVGIMAKELDRSVDTFNVSFDEGEFSESKYARLIAKKFNTNHHEIRLNPNDFLASLPKALKSIDHPSGDGPNSWIVSGETKKQGISVALSGLGGDELFGGYDVFRRIPEIAERSWLLSFPKFVRGTIGRINEIRDPGMASLKKTEILKADYFDLENLYPTFRKVLLDDQIQTLTKTPRRMNEVGSMIQELELYDEFSRLPVLSRISIAEMNSYMQNVLLRDTDQMSMAHALEVRVPFLDHELVEYMMHVKDDLKFPYSPKKLLVEAFSDILPGEIVDRPKMGFVLPWEFWMKNELKGLCEDRLNFLKATGILDGRALDSYWNDFLNGSNIITWSRIWPLVVLADWMNENDIEA